MAGSTRGVFAGLLAAVAVLAAPPEPFARPLARPARVTVVVRDSGLALSRAKVPVGRVAFHVRNAGKQPHDFEIGGAKTAVLKPGGSATLVVRLGKPGRFAYSSSGATASQGVLVVERVTTVDVTEYEWGFKLSQDTVPAGKVIFQMRNAGGILHNFDLMGISVGPFLVPGQTASMTVNLKPGQYVYVCSVKYHAAQGMQGTLVVK